MLYHNDSQPETDADRYICIHYRGGSGALIILNTVMQHKLHTGIGFGGDPIRARVTV